MLDLGLLAFTQPWLLLALLALPALWLLLRITPPAPRRQAFPALRLLLRLEAREETPARTPLWLLLLRLAIAALLILALAGPVLNPAPRLDGSGPLLLVVDDGWAAAPGFAQRRAVADDLLQQAEREGREVLVLKTAPGREGIAVERSAAGAVREALAGWQAKPWPVDRAAAARVLAERHPDLRASPIWLADGVADSETALAAAESLAQELQRIGNLRVFTDPPERRAMLLLPPDKAAERLAVEAMRPDAETALNLTVRAVGSGGEVLGTAPLAFPAGEARAKASFDLPLELTNRVARLELAPPVGVGGVMLLDERWRRRSVGIVGGQHSVADQPLLSEIYFVERAVLPFAEVRIGPIENLLATPLSMIVLTDTGRLAETERADLERWIGEGGVLVRFAGPRLAATSGDTLVPVPLRAGDRQLGGALTWAEPLAIGSMAPEGPFAGLPPNPEARVSRQVLAEPGPHLRTATFAALSDGTPLVTGRKEGKGWLVLVHTTANTSWTSLPLSGQFVEMLRRLLALAPGVGGNRSGLFEAHAVLDADGFLRDPPRNLTPVPAADLATIPVNPEHPPGLYGPVRTGGDDTNEIARTALNLQSAVKSVRPLPTVVLGSAPSPYAGAQEVDLSPWLVLVALLMALVDLVIGYLLRGLLPLPARASGTAAGALLVVLATGGALLGASGPARAQDETRAIEAALETRLAYVRTGLPDVDEISHAGLLGITRVLARRTSVEGGDPVPVDLGTDELAVYPLLYWPVPPEHPDLAAGTLDRVARFLRRGGMILFDTKDAGLLLPGQDGGGPGEARLAQLLGGLDLPPLIRAPADHVLTRSFYLLQDFPGRWVGQPVWVDQVPASVNDGVSSVVIGGNDWAGAWAEDEYGTPLLPVVPGGEEQREMARRFGVNIVMYALTGNYKTDQVHVPALLERLGQ